MRRARADQTASASFGSLAVRGTLVGGLLCLLAGVGLWVAQPVTAEAPADGSIATVEEIQLTLQARQALEQDAALRALNLWVTVKGRVATVSGPVPTHQTARYAEERLRKVDGILKVVSDLRIERPEDAAVSAFTPLVRPRAALPEPRLHAARPNVGLLTGQHAALKTNPHVAAKGGERPPTGPDGEPLLSLPTIRLSVPATGETSAAKPPVPDDPQRPPDVAQAVERLRQADERFSNVRAEVVDGAVFLRGSVRRGEDQFTLAEQIRQLPGVARVVLADVRIRP